MADSTAQGPAQPYTWMRCVCGNALWRLYDDHIEMTLSPRGGQKRTIRAPDSALGIRSIAVTCEKCGHETRS